jgi:hypothetical protein
MTMSTTPDPVKLEMEDKDIQTIGIYKYISDEVLIVDFE